MPATDNPYPHFRLNLEQQKKRAKELLRDARSGSQPALECMGTSPLILTSAQHVIARELRFSDWAALKAHIISMNGELKALDQSGLLDDDCRTMHIRCGHDIMQTLKQAGFGGDFNLHINPYTQGPVTDSPDWLEQRARFIVAGNPGLSLTYEKVLQACHE